MSDRVLPPEPRFYDLLSSTDREHLKNVQNYIRETIVNSGRMNFGTSFKQIIEKIKKFIVKNDGNDHIRSLVCGIVWLEGGIAINTRQLTWTIEKSKSSINNGFHKLGYSMAKIDPETAALLVNIFPFMKNNMSETRQWTLRRLIGGEEKIKDLDCCSFGDNDSLENNDIHKFDLDLYDHLDVPSYLRQVEICDDFAISSFFNP